MVEYANPYRLISTSPDVIRRRQPTSYNEKLFIKELSSRDIADRTTTFIEYSNGIRQEEVSLSRENMSILTTYNDLGTISDITIKIANHSDNLVNHVIDPYHLEINTPQELLEHIVTTATKFTPTRIITLLKDTKEDFDKNLPEMENQLLTYAIETYYKEIDPTIDVDNFDLATEVIIPQIIPAIAGFLNIPHNAKDMFYMSGLYLSVSKLLVENIQRLTPIFKTLHDKQQITHEQLKMLFEGDAINTFIESIRNILFKFVDKDYELTFLQIDTADSTLLHVSSVIPYHEQEGSMHTTDPEQDETEMEVAEMLQEEWLDDHPDKTEGEYQSIDVNEQYQLDSSEESTSWENRMDKLIQPTTVVQDTEPARRLLTITTDDDSPLIYATIRYTSDRVIIIPYTQRQKRYEEEVHATTLYRIDIPNHIIPHTQIPNIQVSEPTQE